MMTPNPLALSFASLLVSLPAPDVWVVDDDGGPGVDFQDLQPAVDAAAGGDTLLVKEGVYGGVVIDGKTLHVVAELGETVAIADGQIEIRGLAPTQFVLVRGLEVEGPFEDLPLEEITALHVHDNAGRVWLEDCRFAVQVLPLPPRFGPPGAADAPGGWVRSSASVTIVECHFKAANEFVFIEPPFGTGDARLRSGLFVQDSQVFVHGGVLHGAGGKGGPINSSPACAPGPPGGPGLGLDGGFVHVAGALLRGGDGLHGSDTAGLNHPGKGGAGGPALQLFADSPGSVELRDATLTPGTGGAGGEHIDGQPVCPDGPDGAPVESGGQVVIQLGSSAPGLGAESPTRVGQVANVALAGEPFDYVIFAASALQTAIPLPIYDGVLHLGSPSIDFPFGFLDAAGTGALPIFVPPNPVGFEALTYYLQTVHVTTGLEIRLGPPTTLTAIDPAAAP